MTTIPTARMVAEGGIPAADETKVDRRAAREAERSGVSPDNVFDQMTLRKEYLAEEIEMDQTVVREAYARIADHRAELKTVNRLLSAAKPRNRAKKGKT